MLSRRTFIAAAAAFGAGLAFANAGANAAYPDRPITMIVPWGAGGGTDQTARIIASVLEKDLGQPVNVVNRTGGSGVVGHQAIASGAPDGYTLGIATVEIAMMHWQGLTQLTYKDYSPIGLVNFDPAGLQVRADSPFQTAKDLVEAIQKKPGAMKASGTGQGGIWHLGIAGMLDSLKIPASAVPWVPSQGAAPGLQDLVAGGVDIVPCSLPEARSLIEAGKVRSLAIMDSQRNPIFPNVPTLKEAIGSDWNLGAWRGIVAPKGLSKEAADKLVPALKKVYDSKEYQDFMSSRGYGVIYKGPQDFEAFMAASNDDLGRVMKAVGIAK